MQEIRFHGRGGQGTVVASIILAKSFFEAGFFVQAFPAFGVERRGAPVEAYLRLDNKKIRVRHNIYNPNHIIVQDRRLFNVIDPTLGLAPGGWVLVNSPSFDELPPDLSSFRTAVVDAAKIALKHNLGTRTHPMINTAMIGAFAAIIGDPPIDVIERIIREEIVSKQKENCLAAKDAYHSVQTRESSIRTPPNIDMASQQ